METNQSLDTSYLANRCGLFQWKYPDLAPPFSLLKIGKVFCNSCWQSSDVGPGYRTNVSTLTFDVVSDVNSGGEPLREWKYGNAWFRAALL